MVVSGLPNITPIFMRIWLMKMTMAFERLMLPVSLRSAWVMRRACRPTCASPISPSISAFGVSAATESMTMMSTAPERTSMSVISSACSPVSGCETSSSSTLTPSLLGVDRVERVLGVDEGRGAALLLALGDDLQRQRGLARGLRTVDLDDAAARQAADAERDVEPERAGRHRRRCRASRCASPRRMTEPLPNCFSIWPSAAESAFLRFSSMSIVQ